MALSMQEVLLICARYAEARADYERLSSAIHSVLAGVVENRGIKHMVTHRAKGEGSLRRKLWKDRDSYSIGDFEKSLSPPMKDLAAARVLLYLPDDIDPVVDALTSHFRAGGHSLESKDKRSADRYHAYHLQVTCDGKSLSVEKLAPTTVFEVQVCTLSAHIWNELEHDIIYKQPSGKPDAAQEELLIALHGVLNLGSNTASRLMHHTACQASKNMAPIGDADELQYSLRNHRGGPPLRGDFKALFDLLSGLMEELSNVTLHNLLQDGHPKERAQVLLDEHDTDGNYQDAGCIFLQLLPNFQLKVLKEFVSSRPDPPPLFKFALRVALALDGRKGS